MQSREDCLAALWDTPFLKPPTRFSPKESSLLWKYRFLFFSSSLWYSDLMGQLGLGLVAHTEVSGVIGCPRHPPAYVLGHCQQHPTASQRAYNILSDMRHYHVGKQIVPLLFFGHWEMAHSPLVLLWWEACDGPNTTRVYSKQSPEGPH